MAKFNIFKIDDAKKEAFLLNIYDNIYHKEIEISEKKI